MIRTALTLLTLCLLLLWFSLSEYRKNTLLTEENASLQLQVRQLQKLVRSTEDLLNKKCDKEVETEKVVTRTITKIKETPYEVPTTPESQLPESLVRLLDEAYGDLHLRQAP